MKNRYPRSSIYGMAVFVLVMLVPRIIPMLVGLIILGAVVVAAVLVLWEGKRE